MGEAEVEICKVKEPTGLAAVKALWGAEEGQVFMVGKDLNRKRGAMKIMTPCFESANDSEEFAIINIIVSFCRGERLGEVGARMPVSVSIGL